MDIKDLTESELSQLLEKNGFRAFQARQIFDWIYKKSVQDFDRMTNIPAALKDFLRENFADSPTVVEKKFISSDKTLKILSRLSGQELVESVCIPEGKRNTACVSSQVGCKFACLFCASGKPGFIRDLKSAEILGQIVSLSELIKPERVTHVVFMGMGEPLDNFDQVAKAVSVIESENGLAISRRRVTVSTCGIIPGIRRITKTDLPVELSVSLHASSDQDRAKIMPVARKYSLADLIGVLKDYQQKTRRQITFEYILLKDLNTTGQDARRLKKLFNGLDCKLNLIVYNEVKGISFKAPAKDEVAGFAKELEKEKINYTFRRARGQDISAACGQLGLKNQ